tara:strand:- start:60 stop:776 length:717 start_codon:yes stop_codon:yes gene_type:complete
MYKKILKKNLIINYKLNKCYKSRNIISTTNPKFKLYAFCINLKNRKYNMDFIHSEWNEYLNIIRFIASPSATKSHVKILQYIYLNRNNIKFPIVIMEDDVYRKNNFTKYWNQLLDLTECDYVAFDAFFLIFKKNNNVPKDFVSLKEHRMMGFTVYYKRFFDRFTTLKDLNNVINKGIIDTCFTHNPLLIKYTPKEQVCCQIVSKYSTTCNSNTNNYINFYLIAEKKLKMLSYFNLLKK